jgi:hypothetical protein
MGLLSKVPFGSWPQAAILPKPNPTVYNNDEPQGFPMSAPAIIIKQNRLMRRFAEANATSPTTARTPEDIGCRQRWIFRRMVARGVFVPVENGKFYMDGDAANRFKQIRLVRLLVTLGVAVVVVLIVIATSH